MTPDQLAELARSLEAVEGRVPHMYLDTGNPPWVTCGIGHRIATAGEALALPFTPATAIATDFMRVSAAQRGMRESAYAALCESRLDDGAIDALLNADIQRKLIEIRARFRDFDAWPGPAQLAVADMAFNLGVGGIEHKFPRFTAAVDRCDWAACAAECNRPQLSRERNERTADLFRSSL
jgi:type VI secretion system secreted protein VgrG